MEHVVETENVAREPDAVARTDVRYRPARQAYSLLHFIFVLAPTIAGLDKFFHLLTNWDQYLAPQIAQRSPIGGHNLMLAVGVVEILAGLIVALWPRIGGWIVGLWMLGIVANLLLAGNYFDIALRDFGLAIGAFSLARLGVVFDARRSRKAVVEKDVRRGHVHVKPLNA